MKKYLHAILTIVSNWIVQADPYQYEPEPQGIVKPPCIYREMTTEELLAALSNGHENNWK